MKKILLPLVLLISFLVCGCFLNVVMKDGHLTNETIPKEFYGKNDYKTILMPFYGARFIGGSLNNLTINEVIDILRPKVVVMRDIDTFAKAIVIDPVTRLEGDASLTIAPWYREKNIVCLLYRFSLTRKSNEFPGDQVLDAPAFIEYDSDTGKIVRENVPYEEAMEKRSIFMKDNINRVTGVFK